MLLPPLPRPPHAFPSFTSLSEDATIRHQTNSCIKVAGVYHEALQALRTSCSLCIGLEVPLKHVWGVRLTNEFVFPACLVSTGPMYVDHASTRTAVPAGRPCREGTSALSVSDFFLCGVEWLLVISCHHIRLRTRI